MALAEELGLLCRWDIWANRQVLVVLRGSGGEPADALAALQHALATELTWLRRIDAAPDAWAEPWGRPSATCERSAAEAAERLARLVTRNDEEWAATFTYRNSSGREFTDSVQRAMLHALTHSAHYRGEAAGFLNHSGHRVPDLDYIFWLRAGAPA